ncbi:RagB/SusD family nutrient uptake outer membrane protein [Parabacteroides sp. OttesenSCG-928-G06]|nr:RagB/SusD family nutrient uptake outer membrane protein [Parabacteroides sp. OttesenSCG-928-K15]MDL2281954.1 RagB/SusD family nutrient uptake outer membrane protein [Parabacteroides sp. OttesenSCG-928-G06]
MKNKYKIYLSILFSCLFLATTSCIGDLDQEPPLDKSGQSIHNEADCQSFLAKIYSGFGLSGNVGPSGDEPDLQGDDQGSLVFLRGLLSMQLYPTDEAIWNWSDEGIVELCEINWDYTLFYAYTFYQRAMLNIRYCKEFLDVYPADSPIADIEKYRNEVRGIRAMNYYYLMDLYRNPGVVWDDSPTNDKSWTPSQIGAQALFDLIVNELKDLSENSNLPETPTMATYGRITKPVVNTLLAKMYLNAEVYVGTPMYDKAAEYASKVINAGFGLEDNYSNLFCGENHLTGTKKNEIIYAIPFDDVNAKSYGSTIMVTAAAFGGVLDPTWFGITASWTCLKPTQQLIALFDGPAPEGEKENRYGSLIKKDKRYQFFDVKEYNEDGTVKERRDVNTKMGDWNTGYLCHKFTNLGWDGAAVSPTGNPNTDFPLFRLADIYLIYAECAARGAAGANRQTALEYVNRLRERANGDASQNIQNSQLTLDFILAERARELYWEGQRRSDLIRFGKFTKGYAWAYKGGDPEGIENVDDKFMIYPISDRDLTANPKLKQNPGYESL